MSDELEIYTSEVEMLRAENARLRESVAVLDAANLKAVMLRTADLLALQRASGWDNGQLAEYAGESVAEMRRVWAARQEGGAGDERPDVYPDERVGGSLPTCSVCGVPVFGGPRRTSGRIVPVDDAPREHATAAESEAHRREVREWIERGCRRTSGRIVPEGGER